MKPITAEERQAFGADLIAATNNRAWARRGSSEGAFHFERDFASYVGALDVAETRLLITEAVRHLMQNRTRDVKVQLCAWIAAMARSVTSEGFGHISDVAYFPDFERTCANQHTSWKKARPSKKTKRK